MNRAGPSMETVLYGGLIFLSILFFIYSIWKNRKATPPVAGFDDFILPLLLAGALVWMGHDAPPLEHDYQETDVVCPSDSGYALLNQLSQIDAPAFLDPVLAEMDDSEDDPVKIAIAWQEIKPYRQIIDELAKFETICDLPPQSPIDDEILFLNYTPLKTLTLMYNQHFLSDESDGRQDSRDEFIRLFSIWVKVFKNSRTYLHKMMFASLLDLQIKAAFSAVCSGRYHRETLEELENMTKQLDISAISLKRPVITEYLILKYTLLKLQPEQLLDSGVIFQGLIESETNSCPAYSRWLFFFGFKPNLTLSQIKPYFDQLLNVHDRHPR